jgi:hypothetical protein
MGSRKAPRCRAQRQRGSQANRKPAGALTREGQAAFEKLQNFFVTKPILEIHWKYSRWKATPVVPLGKRRG